MNKSLTVIFIFICQVSLAQTAKEIIEAADNKMKGTSSNAVMTMQIIRPDWTREISMKSWAVGNEKSLTLITAPARDKGVAFLKRDKEIWNWQPSIDRIIKLPPSMMMQSWMGSDFKNDDLVKESSIVSDYEHKLVGDTVINNYQTHKIELIPHEDAPVVWGKIEVYITKKDLLQLLVKYYDEDNYLINTMKLSDIKNMDGRVIPTRLTMIPADEPDNSTVIIYNQMKFNIEIMDRFFSIQNVKRVR